MDKITQSLLESFAADNGISDLEQWKQFEHFTNFCVISKLYRNTFELAAVHTGKGGDGAFDGIAIIVNGQIIEDIDELRDVVQSSGFLDCDVIFIQAKTSSSFQGSQIGNFIFGVKDFISDSPKLIQNEFLGQRKEIWEAVISMSALMHNRRPNSWLYYVTTGSWQDDPNLLAVINSGVKEIKDSGLFQDIRFTPLGADEIQRLFHETKNKLSTTISFQSRITLPDIQGVTEAYLGVLPFTEFMKLVQDESGQMYNIFDENIRDFLGSNDVNKKIEKSLTDRKFELFSILNNGVTLVATSLTPAGNRFTIRDYQIVNGCQTSNVLHRMQSLDGIDQIQVPVKIIVTANDDIKNEVTIAINSQTDVKPEQLEALTQFQKKLELYYQSIYGPVHLYYERRSRQYHSEASVRKTQIITIPIQIKTFAAAYLNVPHSVSGYYGTIVKKFGAQIFNKEHQLSPYYASALCYYRLESLFRSEQVDPEFKKLRFHLIMIARILSSGINVSPFSSNALDKQATAFLTTMGNDTDAVRIFHRGIQICKNAGLDLSKRQFKAESETEALVKEAAKSV